MFSKKLESIFTKNSLKNALSFYKKARDYHEVLEHIESGKFEKEIFAGFVPSPVKFFEIEKDKNSKRELAISSTSSKVVQKIIVFELENTVKFSDRSYAYRKNKGTTKAVNRVKDSLKKNFWVAKADIDDFFDTINQDILFQKLNPLIKDKRVIKLIALFFKNGMLKSHTWIDKKKGVYQGDNLSPWLSNLYLNDFDHYLEEKNIDFIRYADDMVFLTKHRRDAIKALDLAEGYLNSLKLTFGKDKTLISNKKEGFSYLGLFFKEESVSMDNSKLQKKISKLSKKTKKLPLEKSLEVINEHIDGVKRYYAKVLSNKSSFDVLKKHIDDILIRKTVEAKISKRINKKSKFIQILHELKTYDELSKENHKRYIEELVSKAYEEISLKNPLKTAQKEIQKSKSRYLKESIKSSEIILSRYGLYAGVTKGKVMVKEYGKVIKQIPLGGVSRIVVLSPGVNISSMLIYQCSKKKIDIDFIYKDEPYAMISYYKSISKELYQKQLELSAGQQSLLIAKSIIKAKVKNQLNLIKYYARYRENHDREEFLKLEEKERLIQKRYEQIDRVHDTKTLMGIEGICSKYYWEAFGILIDRPDFSRTTQNAPDAVNQAINYGYGFLYHRVQSALLKAGVSLYHSFLHSPQANKPTLVFDMVEEFRQAVVDREIVSILNRGTKLNSSKGKLTQKSLKVVTQNIQERLITPTRWKKGRYKLLNIIDEQMLQLSKVISGEKTKYKGYMAKY